jgi:hypothetical protein
MAVSFIGWGNGVPRENHWPALGHWQTLSQNVVSSTSRPSGFELTTLVVMCTDCIGSYKSNYHTITTAPIFNNIFFFFKKERKIRVIFFLCKGCDILVFSSPDPKGHVSYCHHLASVSVVRRKLFKKSSPLSSIFSNSGHVGWCTESPDTILKLDSLVMIQTKFGFHWSCTFRGEDFLKSLRRTTETDAKWWQ